MNGARTPSETDSPEPRRRRRLPRPSTLARTERGAKGRGSRSVDLPGFRSRAGELGLSLDSPCRAGSLAVDLDSYEVSVGGRTVHLSAVQVELCAIFVASPGRVWPPEVLAGLVGSASTRSVEQQLKRIRAKVGREQFRTVRGRGWALQLRPDAPRA